MERQLAAILRASLHGPLRILLPMISSRDEVVAVRLILERVAAQLRAEGVRLPDKLPPLGVMIEVPGAALAADARGVEWIAHHNKKHTLVVNKLLGPLGAGVALDHLAGRVHAGGEGLRRPGDQRPDQLHPGD